MYNASSPDELALVNGARHLGFKFIERDEDGKLVVVIEETGETVKYKLLNLIEFDSTRKRMTTVLETPDNEILVICKGADSIIEKRLRDKNTMSKTAKYLEDFSNKGLRTLLIAGKIVPRDEYNEWNHRYSQATILTKGKAEKLAALGEELEVELELIGSTAIEDKLQDEVGQTIKDLKAAGIQLWVLTGDKVETAINIGFSCELLNKDMNMFLI